MNTTTQLAKHLKEFYFGKNWTAVDHKKLIADITWQEATTKVFELHTIATLVFHIHYYIGGAMDVLEGKPLTIRDTYSFDVPPIQSETDWNNLKEKIYHDAEKFSSLVENLSEDILFNDFTDKKYGNYFRNLLGIIEHAHYHLGQISLLKKIIKAQ